MLIPTAVNELQYVKKKKITNTAAAPTESELIKKEDSWEIRNKVKWLRQD